MKKILFLFTILLLVSCKEETVPQTVQVSSIQEPVVETIKVASLGDFPYSSSLDEMIVREIDGCEYVLMNSQTQSDATMCHKGNCKYCNQRRIENEKLLITEIVKALSKDSIQ